MILHFDSLTEFFAMGGHGFYVWLSYGIVFLAFLLQSLIAKSAIGRVKRNLARYYKRLESRNNN